MAGEIITAGEAIEGVKVVTTIAKIATGCVQRRTIDRAELEQMKEALDYAKAMRRRGYLRMLADATLTDIEELSNRIYEMQCSEMVSQQALNAAYRVLDGYVTDMESIKAKMLRGMQ